MENLLNLSNGFTLFGLEIRYYGITMALSYVLALVICLILCKKKKYNENLPYKLLLIAFPLAVIGGRLGYVIFSGREWTLGQILDLRSGGLMLYGGVLLALVGIWIYAIVKKQNVLKYLDLIAPCLIIAQALGRWGNFFNQEAYGNLITNPAMQWFPFGVYIEKANFTSEALQQVVSAFGSSSVSGAWFYATFFYESLWCFLSFFVLYFVYLKTNKIGLTTALYLVLYGTERLLVEGVRTDSLYVGSSNLRVSQLISIIMIVLGLIYLIYIIISNIKQKKLALVQGENEAKQKEQIPYVNESAEIQNKQYDAPKYDGGKLTNEPQVEKPKNELKSTGVLEEVKTSGNQRVEKIKNQNRIEKQNKNSKTNKK